MKDSQCYTSVGKKKNTRHKETPTTRQSLLLYTTPLFTLHSKSLFVPSNQLTEALYAVCKTKTKMIFAGFQPLPRTERG